MENEFQKELQQHIHRHERRTVGGFALLLVATGIALLGFNVGWFPAEYKPIVISWQMLLVAIGLLSIFKRHIIGGLILICIGAYFLMPVIERNFPGALGETPLNLLSYWPVLLILAGLAFLFRKSCKWGKCHSHKYRYKASGWKKGSSIVSDSDYISKDTMFDNSEQIVFSTNFKGGEFNIAFGEMTIDLRKITHMAPDNLLEVNTAFGNTIIYVPANCLLNINTSGTMFASVEDKRGAKVYFESGNASEKMVLNLKCSCIFGKIELRD